MASGRIAQVQVDTALTLANILAAKNKLYQDRVLRFLQTGDETHIADLGLGGIDGYRKLIEGLQKVTGQDKKKDDDSAAIPVVHLHHTVEQVSPDRPPTAKQAEEIVDAILVEVEASVEK